MHEATAFTVAVAEYLPEQIAALPPEKWIKFLKENTGPLGQHVIKDKNVELDGLKGWEHHSEAENSGRIVARLFWVERRLYLVQVAFNSEFVTPGAAQFFMDSFHIDQKTKSEKE